MPVASAYLNDYVASDRRVRQPNRLGIFTRIAQVFENARQRQVEGDIARLIESGGGRLTDSLERQIERYL